MHDLRDHDRTARRLGRLLDAHGRLVGQRPERQNAFKPVAKQVSGVPVQQRPVLANERLVLVVGQADACPSGRRCVSKVDCVFVHFQISSMAARSPKQLRRRRVADLVHAGHFLQRPRRGVREEDVPRMLAERDDRGMLFPQAHHGTLQG
jgi:hypothetical protein